MAAIENYPDAIFFASERIKNDKNYIQYFINVAIDKLGYFSQSLLHDREYMLSIIEYDARAYFSCVNELRDDPSFLDTAIRCNPEVRSVQ